MASNIPRPAAVTGPGPPVQSPSPAPALTAPSPNPTTPAQPPPMASYTSLPPARADASAQPPSMAPYYVGPRSNAGNSAQQPHMVSYNPYPLTGPGAMMHPPPAPRPSHRSIPSAGMSLAQQQQQQQQAMAAYHQHLQAGRSSVTPVPSMAAINQLSNIHQRADPVARMRATNSPFNLPPAMLQTAPARSQQPPPQQHQPPAHHPSPSPAQPQQTPPTHQQQTHQLQQQQRQQPVPSTAPPLPQPPLIEPHPLSPSLADLKLISHPIAPDLLPHLSLTTASSLARLFLDFEYRDLSTSDYAVPDVPPAQRAWLATHLRALNAARRASGELLVAHWRRLVRERAARCRAAGGDWVADGEDVPGGGEAELRKLDWVAREVYGRCADGTRLPVLVWEYVQLRQVRGPSAKEWEDFVVDAVGEVWRMRERRERARRGVEKGEEGEGEEEVNDAENAAVVRVGGGVVGEAELRAAMRERQRRQRSVEFVEVPLAGVSKMRSPPRAAGRQRSNTVSKPKPAKLAQSKTPRKRGGKKGSKGQVMFQAPPAGSSGSAVNPIAVDGDLPDYPDDYGTGNMSTVPDKYNSPASDRTVTVQDIASQLPHYPEIHDIKSAEQFSGSQSTTPVNTNIGLSNIDPAPATQLPDYPPIFSTGAESTQAGTQEINVATTNPNVDNSPHTPANSLPNFPQDYMNPSSGQQPAYPPKNHSTGAASTPPSTLQDTPIKPYGTPSSAAANTSLGDAASATPPPPPPPNNLDPSGTQPGPAETSSTPAPPAAPPATNAPQSQANNQDLAFSQLDGAFDTSDEALDALFNGILDGA